MRLGKSGDTFTAMALASFICLGQEPFARNTASAAQSKQSAVTASLSPHSDQVGAGTGADPDAALMADLRAHGTKIERPRVVVWFAADLVSRADEQRWADLMSQGIDDIEKLLGLAFGPDRLESYIDERLGAISHSVKTVPPQCSSRGVGSRAEPPVICMRRRTTSCSDTVASIQRRCLSGSSRGLRITWKTKWSRPWAGLLVAFSRRLATPASMQKHGKC